jgi:hypothetical protein
MVWNSTVTDMHTFNCVITVTEIYHQQYEIGGKNIVYNIKFNVTGTDTDGSGNNYTLENEMLAFNPSSVDTSSNSFIDIENITDDIARGWVEDFFANNNNLDVAFTNLLYGPPDPEQ